MKRGFLIGLISIVFILLLIGFVSTWADNGSSSQNIDGCNELNTTNATYTLTSNVSSQGTCFTIAAPNITLDCNGYWINYSINGSDAAYGVYTNQFNTTIKNCNVVDGNFSSVDTERYALYLSLSNYSSISDCFILSNNSPGIEVYKSYFSSLINNTMIGGNRAIHLLSTNNTLIKDNTGNCTLNNPGMHIYGISSNNTLINNSILSAGYGLLLESAFSTRGVNNNLLINNTFISTGRTALLFSKSDNNTIINQIAEGRAGYEIGLENSANNLFRDCINLSGFGGDIDLGWDPGSFNNTFINCSYEEEYIPVSENWMLAKWYYQAFVNNTEGSFLSNVNITAYNSLGNVEFTALTNSSGWIPRQEVTDYNATNSGREYYSNYTIFVNKTGTSNSSKVYNVTLNLNKINDFFTLEEENVPGENACGTLDSANTVYTLISNVSSNGTCFTITQPNITLDCNGYWINYSINGSTNTYGVYTNQFNTTIKNCNIVDGNMSSTYSSRQGILFYEENLGKAYNNFISANNSPAIYLYNFDYCNLTSNLVTSYNNHGIFLQSSSNNTLEKNNIVESYWSGLTLNYNSRDNIIKFNNLTSYHLGLAIYSLNNTATNNFIESLGESTALHITSSNSSIENNTLISNGSYALHMQNSNDSLIVNNNLTSNTGNLVVYFYNSSNNLFSNNTLISGDHDGNLIRLNETSTNNLLYGNNFTRTLGYFIDNNHNSNNFNTTNNGIAQGNYYYNITSLDIFDSNGNSWGDTGSDYPLNSTSWPIRWNNLGEDFGPYTTREYSEVVLPSIGFEEPPTPENGSIVNSSSQTIVANISDTGNTSSWIDFDRSLVGYWSMDYYNATGVYDNSTYNNHGTFNGGLNYSNLTTGARGQGLTFDGDNDYLTMEDILNMTQQFTVSVWVKTIGNSTMGEGGIIHESYQWGSPNGGGFFIIQSFGEGVGGSGMYMHARIGNYSDSWDETSVNIDEGYPLDTWRFYTVVWDYPYLITYLNGDFFDNTTFPYTLNTTWNNLQIGSSFYNWDLNGSIDEVMIFNRTLSESEIQALYNSQSNKFNVTFTDLSEGQHNYTVCAIDESGNYNTSGERYFILEEAGIPGENACGTLDSAGTTYTLTSNVSSQGTCFTITQPNITLDCAGYWINYSINGSANTRGIYSNQFNTTIKNCNVVDGNFSSVDTERYGIYFNGNDNSTLINNFVNTSNSRAIYILGDSYFNDIINNTGKSYSEVGIYAVSLYFSSFINNTFISDSYPGMDLGTGSYNNIFINNTFISDSNWGMLIYGAHNNSLTNCTIISNNSHGLALYLSQFNVIMDSFIQSLSVGYHAVEISSHTNKTLFKNVDLSSVSLDIYSDSDSLDNEFVNCSYGINKESIHDTSRIIRKWYYQAYTNYSNGTAVDGVNVSAYNTTGDLQFSALTNSSGYIERQEIVEYVNTGGTRSYYNNYTINASLDGYGTESNVFNFTVTQNKIDDWFTLTESGDLTPPTISFEPPTPENSSTVNSSTQTIIANISDNSEGNTSSWIDFDRSLLGYWSFDYYNSTGIYDNSSYGNFGTFNGNLSGSNITTGVRGQGLMFDGVDDYINISKDSLIFNTVTFTTSMWINPKEEVDDSFFIANTNLVDPWCGWGIRKDGGGSASCDNGEICLWLSECNGGSYEYIDYAYAFPVDSWTHLVIIFDNSTKSVKFYINGSLVNSETSTYGIIFSPSNTFFSIFYSEEYSGMNGSLDEIMLFNRSLSETEVLALYNSQSNKFNATFTDLSEGQHNYTVYAIDESGNYNTSGERYFTFEEQIVGENACGTLDSAGTTYALTSNVSSQGTCFTITQPNITLDCNGYSINYSINGTENTRGIYSNQFNTTIKNCNVVDGNYSSTANLRRGIYLSNSDNSTLYKNFAISNNSNAIDVRTGSEYVNLTNNTGISTSNRGIYLSVTRSIIRDNVGMSNSSHAFDIGGGSINNLFIKDIGITNSTNGNGIILYFADNNTLINCSGTSQDEGIIVYGSKYNALIGITAMGVSAGSEGIRIENSNHSLVRDCWNITGDSVDVVTSFSLNSTFINCSYNSESVNVEPNYLIRKWYYQAYTNYTNGTEVGGANISAYNSTGDLQFSVLSNSSGLIERQEVIEYINTGGTRAYYNNYTINASLDGYGAESNVLNFTIEQNKLDDWFTLNGEEQENVSKFVSVWDTRATSPGSTNSSQVGLPLEAGGIYNFTVYWGDDSNNTITSWSDTNVNHTYASEGIYTINITGTIQGFRFNNAKDRLKLLEIQQWGPLNLGNNGSYFNNVSNLNITATDVLNLTGTTNMGHSFRDCKNITSVPSMNEWDMSSVTDIRYMFNGASLFNENISNWNTGNVTNMDSMFLNAWTFNQNIGNWNTSKVTTMYLLFYSASSFNGNISNWDTSSVTDMGGMFWAADAFNQSIGNWDTGNVVYMNNIFRGASSFNQSLENWNTSKVITMASMFYGATDFNENISTWNTGKVTNMDSMFQDASSFNQPIGNWDISNVINMQEFFAGASSFNQSIGNWDTGNVSNMNGMFIAASSFNQPIGNWNISNVSDIRWIFANAIAFNQSLENWNTSKITNMDGVFYGADAFNENISTWNTSNVLNMAEMFSGAESFNQNIAGWDTSKVTDMNSMFSGADAFNQPIGAWDTSRVIDMHEMFYSANNFNQPIGAWDTGNVSEMDGMFLGASLFNQDISGWNTSNVTDMRWMFIFASAFNQNISSWDIHNVTNMTDMFSNAGLFTENYDSLLGGWSSQNVKSGVFFNAGTSKYSNCSVNNATAARAVLIDTYNWTITDGGFNASYVCSVEPDTTSPTIAFESPTPENGATINTSFVYLNATINDSSETSSWVDWNRSLLGYWSFDYYNATGIYDNSSYENFGEFSGGLTGSNITQGNRGNSLGFSASNSVLVDYNEKFNFDDMMTISAWVYVNDVSSTEDIILAREFDGVNFPYLFAVNPSGYLWLRTMPMATKTATSTRTVPYETWTHVAVTFNKESGETIFYINGEPENPLYNIDELSNSTTSTQDIEIGHYYSHTFRGYLDEVMLFHRTLSPEEINASYNSELYSLKNNFTNLTEGQHNYTVYAIDEAGNYNTSGERYFTLEEAGNPGENACGTLDSAGTTYTLTSNVSSSGTCFTIGADNITLDCNGYWINYSWGEFGYGVSVTDYNNLTVRNCNVIGGITEYTHGILLQNSNNAEIYNNNITVFGGISDCISIYTSNYTSISNNTLNDFGESGHAIYSRTSSYNNVSNSIFYAYLNSSGIYLEYGSHNWSIFDLEMFIEEGRGIVVNDTSDETFLMNNNITSNNSGRGIIVDSSFNELLDLNLRCNSSDCLIVSGSNNTIINSSFNSDSGYSVNLTEGENNSFIGNTFSGGEVNGSLLTISDLAGNNLFYWNNFTSTEGYYINNSNSTNMFNTTILGIGQGNYYSDLFYKIIYDSNEDGWGDSGSDYPLNSSNWVEKWIGFGSDYAPATSRQEDLISPIYNLVSRSSKIAGEVCNFRINITDNYLLDPNGQYIFSTNNTGVWVNDTPVNFTSNPSLSYTPKTLNSSVDVVVGYRWYFKDFAGNRNSTKIYTLITEEEEEDDGGGGGGSGSSDEDDVIILRPSYKQVQEGYETAVSKGYLIQFNLSDKGQYLAEIKDVNRFIGIANLSINSTNYSVELNKSIKINLNNDSYYDLEASLLMITFFNSSRMLFKEIHENISSSTNPGVNETSLGNRTVVDFFGNYDNNKSEKFLYFIVVGIIIVLMALVSFFIFLKFKKTPTPPPSASPI